MDVGKNIKHYMLAKGISQKFLSVRTGISTSKIALSLNGKRKITIEEYSAICNALEVELDRFLERDSPKKAKS